MCCFSLPLRPRLLKVVGEGYDVKEQVCANDSSSYLNTAYVTSLLALEESPTRFRLLVLPFHFLHGHKTLRPYLNVGSNDYTQCFFDALKRGL